MCVCASVSVGYSYVQKASWRVRKNEHTHTHTLDNVHPMHPVYVCVCVWNLLKRCQTIKLFAVGFIFLLIFFVISLYIDVNRVEKSKMQQHPEPEGYILGGSLINIHIGDALYIYRLAVAIYHRRHHHTITANDLPQRSH